MQASSDASPIAMTPKRAPTKRATSVDLSTFPDLIVVYLGFRVTGWKSLFSMLGLGRGLNSLQCEKPDGLLAHENLFFGFNHIGMRQYWRDFDSLERFTQADPHKTWWANFTKDNRGAGFWHEAYRRSGGIEGVYINMPPLGLAAFAPSRAPVGAYARSRGRLAA